MPDVSTEVAIATTTLGSATSTITFSSIPATYTDLRLVLVARASVDNSSVAFRLNNDSSTVYSLTSIYGNGSSAVSSRSDGQSRGFLQAWNGMMTATTTAYFADIFSYTGSTFKTVLATGNEDVNGAGSISSVVNLWRNTAAVNRLDLIAVGANFSIGTTATLYGIL